MRSHILVHRLEEIIYFESEDLNFFTPFCSDIESIEFDIERNDITWCSLDPSDTNKPLTLVVDVKSVEGRRSEMVVGAYLFDENLTQLRTYEGDHNYDGKLEYYAFESPRNDILKFDEKSEQFSYIEGFKTKLLKLICNA